MDVLNILIIGCLSSLGIGMFAGSLFNITIQITRKGK